MANAMVRALKRRVVRHFPDLVASIHEHRFRRQVRRFGPRPHRLGFRFTGPGTMQDGTFEPRETAFILEQLETADVFVDVGANAGYFVCLARQRGKRVVAVEPAEHNLALLYANLESNAWMDVEVFPLAVGERVALATLYGDGTGASFVGRWAGMSEAWRRTVPQSTLDTLVGTRFEGSKLLIKIDVEGAEHAVMCGAERLLRRSPAPVWLVEVCFRENFPTGVNPRFRDLFSVFWANGYTAWSLEAARAVQPADVDRWLANGERDFGYVSYVFEKDRSRR